jgi:hypothetical protein
MGDNGWLRPRPLRRTGFMQLFGEEKILTGEARTGGASLS